MIKWFKEKDILLRVVAVLLAVCLWLYIVGVENPESDIDVRNINLNITGQDVLGDRSLTVTGGLDTSINLRVRGRRSDLSKIVKNENITAAIDLSDIKTAGTYNHVYDVTLPSGITVLDKSPYSVNLTVDELATASIPIKVKLEGSIAQGYLTKEPTAVPSTIKAVGPKDVIDHISQALVILKRENVNSSITHDVLPYKFVDSDGKEIKTDQLTADVSEVSVSMDVLKTKQIPLSVQFTEGGGATMNNVSYTLSPDSIQVAGDPNIIDGLNQIMLGSVDLASVMGSTKQVFQILLPNDVTNLSGITQSTMTLDIKGLKTQSLETSNIEIMHVPQGYKADLITQLLPILIRGPEQSVAQVKPFNLRVVVDLQNTNLPPGLHTVPAQVFLDGFTDVGIISQNYSVAIQISVQSTQ